MSNLWTGERYAQIVEVGFVGDQGQGRYGILFQGSFDEEGFVFPGAITIIVDGDEDGVLDERVPVFGDGLESEEGLHGEMRQNKHQHIEMN